jgi:hypothetical protein
MKWQKINLGRVLLKIFLDTKASISGSFVPILSASVSSELSVEKSQKSFDEQ